VVSGLRLGAGLVGLAVTLGVSGSVEAGNGVHPRTPVLWEPTPPCMTIVDRSLSAKLEFTYSIPYEDLRPESAVDEVVDSRTHQFLAFCRGHSLQEPLPAWLSTADVEAAAALTLVKPGDLSPEDILDTSAAWQSCMTRITRDDQRREITVAAASEPVVWDTTGLPVGAYVVNGYTWEPPFNIFSLRGGVVKVVDDPDLAASPPALALRNGVGDDVVLEGESLALTGCVSAMPGSTLTAYWARTRTYGMPLQWERFAADTPVIGDAFELAFTPPPGSAGNLVAVKVEVVDPLQRTMTAHMGVLASVLAGSAGGETGSDCDSPTMIGPGCDSSTGSEGGSSSSTAETTLEQSPELHDGCGGCSAHGAGTLAWLCGPMLLLRRRRRAPLRKANTAGS